MLSSTFPLFGGPSVTLYTRPEGNVPPVAERKGAPSNDVIPGWFRAAGIPLIAGRDFNEQDVMNHPNVIIISKAGAKTVFGDEKSVQLNQANNMEFYRPFAQESWPFLKIVVRSPLPPETITRSVKTALRGIDPSLALIWPQPFSEIMAQALGQAKLMMLLLGVFAGVALLLATVGIYGAVAYSVEQRTGEIGVRMALGAQTRDVLRLIVNQGMKPVVIGLAIGLASAFALGRLITTQLYQVSAYNPALLGGATILLAATALFACLLPARRASMVDPVQALRTE